MDAIEYKRERVPGKLELLVKLDFSGCLSPALMLDMIEWRGGALEPADETAAATTEPAQSANSSWNADRGGATLCMSSSS